jgi:hypothetical protein
MINKNSKINPLNVLGLRRVDFPAHHFLYTTIESRSSSKIIRLCNWIEDNLNGRYYVGTTVDLENNVFVYKAIVGFESKKELTFFKLAYTDLT